MNGEPRHLVAVYVDAETLKLVADLVKQYAAQQGRKHPDGLQPEWALEFVSTARHAAALHALFPFADIGLENTTPARENWISTTQAARQLGITERAVRHRIRKGQLRACRFAGAWRIDLKEIDRDAAA